MRIFILTAAILSAAFLFSCNSGSGSKESLSEKKPEISEEQKIFDRIDTLKTLAEDGDLIVRFNDNLISYQIKNLNDSDRTFSHGGIVMTINGRKMVCNIDADEEGVDTVRYDPIDSFLNPKKNTICGLYRYNLSADEKTAFIKELNHYHEIKAHFDRVFDLQTDNAIYCSEMIYKSLKRATHGRLVIKTSLAPPKMQPLLHKYFEKKLSLRAIAKRKFITIDNLYLIPDCKQIMRFPLKYFPGQ